MLLNIREHQEQAKRDLNAKLSVLDYIPLPYTTKQLVKLSAVLEHVSGEMKEHYLRSLMETTQNMLYECGMPATEVESSMVDQVFREGLCRLARFSPRGHFSGSRDDFPYLDNTARWNSGSHNAALFYYLLRIYTCAENVNGLPSEHMWCIQAHLDQFNRNFDAMLVELISLI